MRNLSDLRDFGFQNYRYKIVDLVESVNISGMLAATGLGDDSTRL